MTTLETVNAVFALLNNLPEEGRDKTLLILASAYIAEKKINGASDAWITERLKDKSAEIIEGVNEGNVRTYDIAV